MNEKEATEGRLGAVNVRRGQEKKISCGGMGWEAETQHVTQRVSSGW